MIRLLARMLIALVLAASAPASAEVRIHFHSFDGSLMSGRYPHAFVVLDGTLGASGKTVNENYGFSARTISPAVLAGPVEHKVMREKPKRIAQTSRHFSLTLTDEQYRRIVNEVRAWAKAPGKHYDLEKRNCIHFVGRMAQLAGLRVEYPASMLRNPKRWLNHIAALNPQLKAAPVP